MNYLQMGVLCLVGLIAIIIWWTCFVGLNRDVTYQNKRTRGPYALPRRKKRPMKPLKRKPAAQQQQQRPQQRQQPVVKRPPRGR